VVLWQASGQSIWAHAKAMRYSAQDLRRAAARLGVEVSSPVRSRRGPSPRAGAATGEAVATVSMARVIAPSSAVTAVCTIDILGARISVSSGVDQILLRNVLAAVRASS
jgi:hypothetical protein